VQQPQNDPHLQQQQQWQPHQPESTSTPSALELCSLAALDTAATAATPLELTGLWRGTFGAHGVELVQLQLLLTPPGYQLLQEHPMPQPPQDVEACTPGWLLQPLLHTPAPAVIAAFHAAVSQLHTVTLDVPDEAGGHMQPDGALGDAAPGAGVVQAQGDGGGHPDGGDLQAALPAEAGH
jgi:hypothetical protein